MLRTLRKLVTTWLPLLSATAAISQVTDVPARSAHLHALAKNSRPHGRTDFGRDTTFRTPGRIATPSVPAPRFDLVIRNGRVIDPETKLDRLGVNIGIVRGTIEAVSSAALSGKQEIDATGLIVAPGFIDLVSYDPNRVGARNKIMDGVTSNLAMHGGTSDPLSWYTHYKHTSPMLNYGASFFYTQARNRLRISSRRAESIPTA